MSHAAPAKRPSRGSRRLGYAVAVAVNAALLYVIIVRPGWQSAPWLTDDVTQVLWLVYLSLFASVVANALYMIYDRRRFKAMCQMIIAFINVVAALRILQVFPFDFSAYSFPWDTLTRWILILVIVGSGISFIVEFVRLVLGDGRVQRD